VNVLSSCCCDDSKSISHQVAGAAAGRQHQEMVGACVESRPTEATPRQSDSESVLGNTRPVSGLRVWLGGAVSRALYLPELLTGPKFETGHVWHGPVNRNCSHSPTDLVCPLWTGLTSTACCRCCTSSSLALQPAN